ncbi:MAG TPA: ATPase, T2SS/T4P/T4SS family, partial [Planctomycetota bacterium]|nr:ATPase, T2SS/T4P/T4SS family [Planctomycetota bacterium]
MAKTEGRLPTAEFQRQLVIERAVLDVAKKLLDMPSDEIFVNGRVKVAQVLNAEHAYVYAKDPAKPELFTKLKVGTQVREFRLPVSAETFSGNAAFRQRPLRIANVTDPRMLKEADPALRFDVAADVKAGLKTRQVLAVPIFAEGTLVGVIELRNHREGQPFTEADQNLVGQVGRAIGVIFLTAFPPPASGSRFAGLIGANLLTTAALENATKSAAQKGCSVEQVLLTAHGIPIAALGKSLGNYFRCEFVPFSKEWTAPRALLGQFSAEFLARSAFVPLKQEGKKAVVLMENPRDLLLIDSIQRQLPVTEIVPKAGLREDIFRFIDLFYGTDLMARPDEGGVGKLVKEMARHELPLEEIKVEQPSESDHGIVKLVNRVIEDAHARGASDIHIEPYLDSETIVRYRIDGVCHEYARLPAPFARPIVARIKIMAGLDIAERRLPQDGKILLRKFGPLDVEIRVASLPTAGGNEDVVMRLLNSALPVKVENLGMQPELLERFKQVISEPYGIVLCVGPTGAGKTTTLHAGLAYLNTPDKKIWTAEDPVEITQHGLRQVQVQPKIGLTFERALRSFLRADPDVIMIGEMRDLETATAAVEASLTGHMVFSTLHTNNAPETVTRLLDLGLDAFAFGDSLRGVLAQRLVRKLCVECR